MSYEYQKLARAQEINSFFKSVLVSLSHFVNKKGQCWPSYQTLSFETGLSIKSVQRAIKYLEENGFIEVQRRQFKHTNVYKLTLSYPQLIRSTRPVYETQTGQIETKQVCQSSQTGPTDLPTTMNSYLESFSGEKQEEQKLYNGDRPSFRSFVKAPPWLVKKGRSNESD